MAKFVFPVPPQLINQLDGVNKLIAFPREPENIELDKIHIFDSGAFGLYQSKTGFEINDTYMDALARSYIRFQSKNYKCIAPDVFLKPKKTMNNFKAFKAKYPEIKICPVFQFKKLKELDSFSFYQQLNYYKQYNFDFVCVSNPYLRAVQAKEQGLENMLKIIKETFNCHIHFLGAGWDLQDIIDYSRFNYLDTFDSVSYYTSAQYKQIFINEYQNKSWIKNALQNYNDLKNLCLT